MVVFRLRRVMTVSIALAVLLLPLGALAACDGSAGPVTSQTGSSTALASEAAGAAEASTDATTSATSIASTTSTTGPPGYMSFAGFCQRFEEMAIHRDLPGMLPYEVLSPADTSWLFDSASPVPVTEAEGYEFAGGDVVVLFYCEPLAGDDYNDAEKAVAQLAPAGHAGSGGPPSVHVWGSDFGFVLWSEHYGGKLAYMAQWSRLGGPMEAYLEQLDRSFGEVSERFEQWLAHEELAGVMPLEVLPAVETDWVTEAVPKATEVAGYALANGDLAILLELTQFPSYEAMEAAGEALTAVGESRYGAAAAHVWTALDEDFAYVVVTSSDGHRQTLMMAAEWARWGGPPDRW